MLRVAINGKFVEIRVKKKLVVIWSNSHELFKLKQMYQMNIAFIVIAALALAFILIVIGLLFSVIYYRWRLKDSHRALAHFIRENVQLRQKLEEGDSQPPSEIHTRAVAKTG